MSANSNYVLGMLTIDDCHGSFYIPISPYLPPLVGVFYRLT